jgi:hypothetical protein
MSEAANEVVADAADAIEVYQDPVLPTEAEVEQTRLEVVSKLDAAKSLMLTAKYPTLVLVAASPEYPITSKSQVQFVTSVAGELATARDLLMFTVAQFGRQYDAAVAEQRAAAAEQRAAQQAAAPAPDVALEVDAAEEARVA